MVGEAGQRPERELTCPGCGCTASSPRHPNHAAGCTMPHLTAAHILAWHSFSCGRETPFGPQHPCPSCNEPMGGVGWRVFPHECTTDDPLKCPHSEHWIGPWGDCRNCTTQEVLVAAFSLNRPQGFITFGDTP